MFAWMLCFYTHTPISHNSLTHTGITHTRAPDCGHLVILGISQSLSGTMGLTHRTVSTIATCKYNLFFYVFWNHHPITCETPGLAGNVLSRKNPAGGGSPSDDQHQTKWIWWQTCKRHNGPLLRDDSENIFHCSFKTKRWSVSMRQPCDWLETCPLLPINPLKDKQCS